MNLKGSLSIIYTTLLILSLSIEVFPQFYQPNQWCVNFPSIPGSGAMWGHASVALGDTLYVHGDGLGTASTVFRKYSISGNNWSAGTPLPAPKVGGDLAACGGRIYYIGGGTTFSNGDPQQFVYNPLTGSWSNIANIPIPVTGNVAECYGNLIYCMFGGWSSYSTAVQVYNVNTNSWTSATSIPAGNGRRSFAGGILGNKLFVCAGYSGIYRNDFWTGTINPGNPTLISWLPGPPIVFLTSRPGGTAIAGRFYVVIGEIFSTGNASDSIAIWDTTAASWSYVDGKPTRSSNYWGAVSGSIVNCSGRWGAKIWVTGGSLVNTNRPLDVFADTCLTGCQIPIGILNFNNEFPEKYELYQNYPNPFNPTTIISYQIPKASNVYITVSDLLGREVAVLVNEFKHAGRYTIEFNADNYSSGIYFYTLKSGEFTDVKKMVIVK